MTLLIERKAKQARALVEQQLVHPLLRWLLVKALWWNRGVLANACNHNGHKCLASEWSLLDCHYLIQFLSFKGF